MKIVERNDSCCNRRAVSSIHIIMKRYRDDERTHRSFAEYALRITYFLLMINYYLSINVLRVQKPDDKRKKNDTTP